MGVFNDVQGQLERILGSPVILFCPFYLGVSLLTPNTREKGTLIIKGLLGNLGSKWPNGDTTTTDRLQSTLCLSS